VSPWLILWYKDKLLVVNQVRRKDFRGPRSSQTIPHNPLTGTNGIAARTALTALLRRSRRQTQ
jgi:hypothetical protein